MKKVLINRYLSLSRAARLVGVKRGTLQKRIQAGDIKVFEGDIALEELLKAYPKTEYEDNAMIDRAAQLKEHAVGKILHEDPILPSAAVLATRIRQLGEELNEANALASKYIKLVDGLKVRLNDIELGNSSLEYVKSWLDEAIDQPVDHSGTSQLIADDRLLSLMTAHVRILPSRHDFFSEGNNSLLEAGLRSGLSLDYGCSNGNCGKCLARVTSGQVDKIRHHDYIISDDKKASGHILMCCNSAVTDVVLEAPEAHSSAEILMQHITAKVKCILYNNEDVALLHLKTPRTNRLRFLAGQYALLGGNDMPAANYSISSCPCDDMHLHFQIPRIAGNEFSEYVFNQLKAGDAIDINGPRGEFILNEDSTHSLVFIAWHTGFAPIRSLVEHAMALDIAESIYLFWISENNQDRYLDNLCRSWADALDNFHYHSINASMNDDEFTKNLSVISKINIELDDLSDYDFYVAGNHALIESSKTYLLKNGLPEKQLSTDLIEHE